MKYHTAMVITSILIGILAFLNHFILGDMGGYLVSSALVLLNGLWGYQANKKLGSSSVKYAFTKTFLTSAMFSTCGIWAAMQISQ